MDTHSVNAYVTQADGDYVRVKVLDTSIETALINFGFSSSTRSDEYDMPCSDNSTKATIFAQLRQLEVCFCAGREWCPAEVFLYLKDIGLLSGGFKRIAWSRPDHYRVTDEQ